MATKETSEFDGGVFALFGVNFVVGFLSIISLGIAFPWLTCYQKRWHASHTKIDGNRLAFDGKGGQLIGNWIKWILLSLVTIGIYSLWVPNKLEKWSAKHTYFAESGTNPGTSDFVGSVLGYIGINIGTFFGTLFTFGIAMPWLMCWHKRWICDNESIEAKPLSFTGSGLGLFGNCVKWVLLMLITFGIYGFWCALKMAKWETKNTTFKD